MKKLTALFLALVLVFAFAACSSNPQSEKETQSTEPQTQSESNISAQPTGEDNSAASGKTLVVYFSASGNTENAANYIAKATNGDLFELVPEKEYTDADLNWRDENSRVNYEHENESARNIALVSSTVDNWDEYDTVFIGYPIWWAIAAWPVDTFVKANDFTGKTVIPFCTSTSSGLGQSGELLAEMAGTGNWLEGERFQSSVSESEVTEWVKSLGI